jgi:hypothetical protein
MRRKFRQAREVLCCRVHVATSVCYSNLGQPSAARLSALHATEVCPQDARSWLAKMNAERIAGNVEQAIADAERAADLDASVRRQLPGLIKGIHARHGWRSQSGKVVPLN